MEALKPPKYVNKDKVKAMEIFEELNGLLEVHGRKKVAKKVEKEETEINKWFDSCFKLIKPEDYETGMQFLTIFRPRYCQEGCEALPETNETEWAWKQN